MYSDPEFEMRITDILNEKKYTLSFEVFPPKTSSAIDTVLPAIDEIASLKPSFMSVTYGAGGGTGKYTMQIAEQTEKKTGVPFLAHLTCVSSSREMIDSVINEMRQRGIKNVMALRGDLTPELEKTDRSKWDYRYAAELVRELRCIDSDLCIGGACYPEVHPESANQNEDIKHLKEKVDAGCDFLTTQMFFDNNLLYNFLYKIREAGITVPVIPGIMPITNGKQVERAIKLSGSFMPQRFKSIVDKFGGDPDAMMHAGVIYAADQIIDLYANGITHVHVYSMNKPQAARMIMDALSDILGKPVS